MSDALVVVVGADATIVNDAVVAETAELLTGLDPGTALESFTIGESAGEENSEPVINAIIAALNTPPFLVPRRVVVVRDVQRLGAGDLGLLVEWAKAPTPDVVLLAAIVGTKSKGGLAPVASRVVDVNVGGRSKDRASFVAERFAAHGVSATAGVYQQIADRLGEEMSRVDSIARSLAAIFGATTLRFEQIEPYLGDLGAVPEWDLTDAIEAGDAARAITVARRMLDSKARVGVQVVGILARRYLKMARLEGSGANTGEEAAAIVGGHEFPARKLVQTTRALGPTRVAQSLELITRADRDLKGGVTYGGDNDKDVSLTDLVVIEVLVARLAKVVEAARRR